MARKEKNIHYIYKTTCNVTGKYYVGMHSTSNENDDYMGSGLHLRRSIRKYGVSEHTKEILSYHDTRDLLIEAEKVVITADMVLDKNCMNLKHGGEGGFSSEEHMMKCSQAGNLAKIELLKNDEYATVFKQKLSSAKSGNKNPRFGKPATIGFTKKSHSEETKTLMSETSKGQGAGETNSQFGTCWITNDIESKKIKKGSEIPDGWRLGRK